MRLALRVQLVAQDRVSDREHVHPQLVAPTRLRQEPHPRPREAIRIRPALQHLERRQTRLSLRQVHHLTGAAQGLLAKRKVDLSPVGADVPRDQRLVLLLDLARLETHREPPMPLGPAREHHHARGIAIEPMHDACTGMRRLQSRHQAIGLLRPDSRHRKEPRILVADKDVGVFEEDAVAGAVHVGGYTSRSMHARRAASPAPHTAISLRTTALLTLACSVGVASGACTPRANVEATETSARNAQEAAATPSTTAAITPAGPKSTVSEPGVVLARQLTYPDRFIKAGESYFSPDGKRIVFQAIEVPEGEESPADFYAMFVCDVVHDAAGDITGVANIRRISPKGSANTCGWFHPLDSNRVLFASTVGVPTAENAPGYQRGTSRYRWAFPPETRMVEVDLRTADGTAASLKPLEGDGKAYIAEGSWSPDGRHLLFCSLESGQGDLFARDLATGRRTAIVSAPGYDGGPFFSPDGKRICYRSDRKQDNLLQVFVADLVFDKDGSITGTVNERQLTSNEHVNWCPFFRPDGKTLVYATSEVGHRNYEVFEIVLPEPGSSAEPVRRRVTEAEGADVLPVFSADGKWLLWTGQRHEGRSSQLYVGEYVDQSDAK